MPKKTVDLIISASWIVPVIPADTLFPDCSVVIADGTIVAVLPTTEALSVYATGKHVRLDDSILMPGLVNAHGHAAMALLRGLADDLPLTQWLNEHIWPAEQRWVSAEFVRDGTELAMAEMLRSGTTCFADMYFFPDEIAAAANRAGMRSQIAFPVLDFPSAWARSAEEYIHHGLAVRDDYRDSGLTRIIFGPHAPYTLDDQGMQKIALLASELDASIHIHLHETPQEIADSVAQYGIRPIDRLRKLGLLTSQTQCVHMTQLSDGDLRHLRDTGASVVHCPQSNLKLASGYCPVQRLINAGITIAIGTDSAASNNSLNLFQELRTAALLAKGDANDPTVLNAHQMLRMATIEGARVLDLEKDIGSIEVGKKADLIAVDMATIEAAPVYNPLSQLVYTDAGQRVSHAWVNGVSLLERRNLTTLDEKDILARARHWQRRIAGTVQTNGSVS